MTLPLNDSSHCFLPRMWSHCKGRSTSLILYTFKLLQSLFSPQDVVTLQGEVHFPNIEFEKTSVDFGCILNDTEVTRYVNMTNCSPMEVKYHWSFLIDDEAVTVYQKLPSPVHQHKMATEDMMDNAELAAELEETIQADLAAEDNIPPGWAMGSTNKVRLRFAVLLRQTFGFGASCFHYPHVLQSCGCSLCSCHVFLYNIAPPQFLSSGVHSSPR